MPDFNSHSRYEKPVVRHDPGMLEQTIDATLDAIANANPPLNIYRWSGGLCKIHVITQPKKSDTVWRQEGSIILVPVESTYFSELATTAAVHVKYDSRTKDDRVFNCPRAIAEGAISRKHWGQIQKLAGIVEAPILDRDGRLIDLPGFDTKTGLYLATSGKLRCPAAPADKMGAWGLKKLLDHIKTFPFVTDADKSAAVAAIMTSLIRRVLPSAPMFGITAPSPGTGKTLLAEMVGIISTGRKPPVISVGIDENEFAKRIYGSVLAGDSILLLDNVNRPIGSEDVLSQLLTSSQLRFRPLGGSGMVSTETNCTVIATGNNLAVVGDAKRRTVLIRLDARLERPEQREFERDILRDTLEQRDDLISAALRISKSYLDAGAPSVGAKPYGSFFDWDVMVRRPLIWLGMSDPLIASESMRDSDPDIECSRALLTAWHNAFATEMTASDVVKTGLDFNASTQQYANLDLHDALHIACREKISSHKLGIWLRQHQDRIVDGLQLAKAGTDGHAKVSRWKVVSL